MRGSVVSDRFCHDHAHSVPFKNHCHFLSYQNRINVHAKLWAKVSSSIRGDLPQGAIACFCSWKTEQIWSSHLWLTWPHGHYQIDHPQDPNKFDKDLYWSRVCGPLWSRVNSDIGVWLAVDRDIMFNLIRKIWMRVGINGRKWVDEFEVQCEFLSCFDLKQNLWRWKRALSKKDLQMVCRSHFPLQPW